MKSSFDFDSWGRRDESDKTWRKWQGVFVVWFVFVALLALALMSGIVWVVYRVLLHLGIL